MKLKTKTWIIYTEFGFGAVPYILDFTNLDVSSDELTLCILEQIYGVKDDT